MFFIARCLFWFIVIYMHLPAGEQAGVNAGRFLDMAGAHVDAIVRQQAPSLAARIVGGGAEWCQANGEACVDAVLAAMAANEPSGEVRPGRSAPKAALKAGATRG